MRRLLQRNVSAFSTKKVDTEIKSVVGHKPPTFEDTVQGKYAGVLFTVASQQESLYAVLEDMKFFKELLHTSDTFQLFLQNIQFQRDQQQQVFQTLGKSQMSQTTQNFIDTLIDNKRVSHLPRIIDKYIDYYRILNKEENITIISAQDLNEKERLKSNDILNREQVVAALKQQNSQVQFTVQYQVDATILGGLQMYSGNKFLDLSLLSRVQKIRGELSKLSL